MRFATPLLVNSSFLGICVGIRFVRLELKVTWCFSTPMPVAMRTNKFDVAGSKVHVQLHDLC